MINVEHARKIIADINGSNINTASKGDALRNMTFTLTGEEICTLLQEIERLRTEQTPFRNAPNPTDWRQPPMPPHQGMYQPQPQDQGIHSGQTPPQVHPAPLRLHECDPYILPQINGPYNDHTKKTAVSLVLNELNSSPRYLRPDANRAMLLELIRDDGNNDDFIELIEVVLYKPGETSPAPGPNPLDVAAIVGSKLSAMVLTKGGTLPMPQVQWAKYYTDAAKKMERTPQGAGISRHRKVPGFTRMRSKTH